MKILRPLKTMGWKSTPYEWITKTKNRSKQISKWPRKLLIAPNLIPRLGARLRQFSVPLTRVGVIRLIAEDTASTFCVPRNVC